MKAIKAITEIEQAITDFTIDKNLDENFKVTKQKIFYEWKKFSYINKIDNELNIDDFIKMLRYELMLKTNKDYTIVDAFLSSKNKPLRGLYYFLYLDML